MANPAVFLYSGATPAILAVLGVSNDASGNPTLVGQAASGIAITTTQIANAVIAAVTALIGPQPINPVGAQGVGDPNLALPYGPKTFLVVDQDADIGQTSFTVWQAGLPIGFHKGVNVFWPATGAAGWTGKVTDIQWKGKTRFVAGVAATSLLLVSVDTALTQKIPGYNVANTNYRVGATV